MIDTVADVINRMPKPEGFAPLPVPLYRYRKGGARLALAVASMRDHTTNEGFEVMRGLGEAGYILCGHGLDNPNTNVRWLVNSLLPSVVLLQDKREWDVRTHDFRDPLARFMRVDHLKGVPGVFKLTILKDAQQRPSYHMQSADEIGCHVWVVYYDERIVVKLAPYVRPQHLLRTYHTVDPATVPAYTGEGRKGCLLSGAVSGAYPLRTVLFKNAHKLPETTVLPHPGYHRKGSATPDFMKTLSRFKVAICTASLYGYALRKLIEATACGCMVVTNLPSDEVLPEIDGNLIRVPSDASYEEVASEVRHCLKFYDCEKQKHYAQAALSRYDYRFETARLAQRIELLRANYP